MRSRLSGFSPPARRSDFAPVAGLERSAHALRRRGGDLDLERFDELDGLPRELPVFMEIHEMVIAWEKLGARRPLPAHFRPPVTDTAIVASSAGHC